MKFFVKVKVKRRFWCYFYSTKRQHRQILIIFLREKILSRVTSGNRNRTSYSLLPSHTDFKKRAKIIQAEKPEMIEKVRTSDVTMRRSRGGLESL